MSARVEVEIVGIRLDPLAASAVLLADPDRRSRVLPIMIGPAEAHAIASSLAEVVPPRPGTHDLATTLLAVAGARLDEVVVTELRDGVFFAELAIEVSDEMRSVSARPSDGIALALRSGAPIFVHSSVLDEAGVEVEQEEPSSLSEAEIDQVVAEFQEFLDDADASDFEPEQQDDDDPPSGDD